MLLSLNQLGKIVEIPSTLLDGDIFVVKIARFHLRISNKIEGLVSSSEQLDICKLSVLGNDTDGWKPLSSGLKVRVEYIKVWCGGPHTIAL